jgi:hypothetical protein
MTYTARDDPRDKRNFFSNYSGPKIVAKQGPFRL